MIGAIADDFTGATDIAVAFRAAGLRVVIHFNGPGPDVMPEHDVAVVALKTRTLEQTEAVRQSLEALARLRDQGANKIFFKYCSTFDSRPDGNIGPVAAALADAVGAQRVVFVPSSPQHGRTQYMGHLFVGRLLLSDSHMRHHPLTPMTDSFIPAVLAAQTSRPVTWLDHEVARGGKSVVAAALVEAQRAEPSFIVVDAIDDADLRAIGEAVVDDQLVTGAAGMAGAWGAALASRLGVATDTTSDLDDPFGGARSAVLAGSCSSRTLEQIELMQRTHPSLHLDALRTPDAAALARGALDWIDAQPGTVAPLIYSSSLPAELRRTQEALGTDRASEILEAAMGAIARGLVARGVQRLIVAGGETSGAVVTALGVTGGVIGREAAPGVPWIFAAGKQPIALLLKSGNFGEVDLLARAARGDAA